MTAVLKYDEACRAVALACSFDEVREWEDKAAAVREYGRRIRNRSLQIDALEIRERARRRRGELLAELKSAGKLGKGIKSNLSDGGDLQTLDDLQVTPNESSRDQKIAALEGNSFERLLARCRTYMEENPDKHAIDVLRVKDGPINGARSVMGSRHEPDDSLDYFPTPPWATRALMEIVLPALGVDRIDSAWEPACGEGHISGVLAEYAERGVYATDVHDYSCDGRHPPCWFRTLNFLSDEADDFNVLSGCEWIITNPPFKERAEQFSLRAIGYASVGVAMFVRLQWLETNGRYERLFGPYPPTMIAQFAERVPLCKGKWDPEGDTATAYLWIIWMPHHLPREHTRFFWIPPGQRDALTKPDDAERFTASPVIALADDGSPTDQVTGEIIGEAAE